MPKIVCVSASVRLKRNSHRAALFFQKFITERGLAEIEILDLNAYQFPIFEERLRLMKDPSPAVLEVAKKIKEADGVIIVTPEYNGGYPAALKNFVDLLYDEWKKKPLALATASDGGFGGTQVTTSLIFSFWKIGMLLVPAQFPMPKVQELFDEEGNAVDEKITGRAEKFINELLWVIEAKKRMKQLG